jgi:hypothetical protein
VQILNHVSQRCRRGDIAVVPASRLPEAMPHPPRVCHALRIPAQGRATRWTRARDSWASRFKNRRAGTVIGAFVTVLLAGEVVGVGVPAGTARIPTLSKRLGAGSLPMPPNSRLVRPCRINSSLAGNRELAGVEEVTLIRPRASLGTRSWIWRRYGQWFRCLNWPRRWF